MFESVASALGLGEKIEVDFNAAQLEIIERAAKEGLVTWLSDGTKTKAQNKPTINHSRNTKLAEEVGGMMISNSQSLEISRNTNIGNK